MAGGLWARSGVDGGDMLMGESREDRPTREEASQDGIKVASGRGGGRKRWPGERISAGVKASRQRESRSKPYDVEGTRKGFGSRKGRGGSVVAFIS